MAGMLTLLRSIDSVLACRFRSREDLEPEVLALRHQLNVLRGPQPSRPRVLCDRRAYDLPAMVYGGPFDLDQGRTFVFQSLFR